MIDITSIKTPWGPQFLRICKGILKSVWELLLKDIYPGIEFAGHQVCVSSFFWIIVSGLLKWLHYFIISAAICERACYSLFLQNPWNCHNLNFVNLMDASWHLVVYSCIFLIINENEAIYLDLLCFPIYFSVPPLPLLVCRCSLQILI